MEGPAEVLMQYRNQVSGFCSNVVMEVMPPTDPKNKPLGRADAGAYMVDTMGGDPLGAGTGIAFSSINTGVGPFGTTRVSYLYLLGATRRTVETAEAHLIGSPAWFDAEVRTPTPTGTLRLGSVRFDATHETKEWNPAPPDPPWVRFQIWCEDDDA